MTADDPRLDPGVIAARNPVWLQDDNQWDGDVLRPGWMERVAPYDPTPQYSRLDRLDGLDETVNPPFPPVRANTLPTQPHTMFGPMCRLYWALIVTPAVGVLVVVFLIGRWAA